MYFDGVEDANSPISTTAITQLSSNSTSLTIGATPASAPSYRYFDGKIDLNEAIRLVKRNSRRYAKRQMTWFRRDEHWQAFAAVNADEIMDYIKTKLV